MPVVKPIADKVSLEPLEIEPVVSKTSSEEPIDEVIASSLESKPLDSDNQ